MIVPLIDVAADDPHLVLKDNVAGGVPPFPVGCRVEIAVEERVGLCVHSTPSAEHQTSLLQIRGKCCLSPGFQPPMSHILLRKTSGPAPSRGAYAARSVTLTQR